MGTCAGGTRTRNLGGGGGIGGKCADPVSLRPLGTLRSSLSKLILPLSLQGHWLVLSAGLEPTPPPQVRLVWVGGM
jgi:hypothetical protein